MQIDGISISNFRTSRIGRGKAVASADEIKSILFLGIKSDIPASEKKRKVDIII